MQQLQKVVARLAEQLGTPRALAVKLLVDAGEFAQLQELRADPSTYPDAETYYKDAIITDLLRKCQFPGDAESRKAKAIDGFLACEKRNWKTNQRLYRFVDNAGLDSADLPVEAFIKLWRKNIGEMLGCIPLSLTPRFSGGSTATDRGAYKTLPDKITNSPSYYPQTQPLLSLWWETAWGRSCGHPAVGRASVHPEVCRSSVFFTVPKDAVKDRGCCMESSISLSYQLAVGKEIRSRLKRKCGIDLQRNQERHRLLAQKASIDGSLATIDLSDASNLICRALPELVLPNQWFELVDSLRAPSVDIDGRTLRLEMFSSMGNGYTFELETLLFYSLAVTVCKQKGLDWEVGNISVYGDDIIVPTEIAADVLVALRYFGFEPNTRKTFVTGPFRESCGGDFFNGVAVRPHYLKELPDEPQHWISLANGLYRLPPAFASRARMECLKNIPNQVRSCQGPESLGDIVVHSDERYWRSRQFTPKGEFVEITQYRVYRPVANVLPWHHWWPEVILASALAGADSDGVTPRDDISGYRLDWVSAPGNGWLPL